MIIFFTLTRLLLKNALQEKQLVVPEKQLGDLEWYLKQMIKRSGKLP